MAVFSSAPEVPAMSRDYVLQPFATRVDLRINYAGELNADATEIAGVWSIGNVFFGAFVMTRASRRAEVKADAKLTTVE